MMLLRAKECREPPEAGRTSKDPPLEALEGDSLASTLTLDV